MGAALLEILEIATQPVIRPVSPGANWPIGISMAWQRAREGE
jgi:hypothetical protein